LSSSRGVAIVLLEVLRLRMQSPSKVASGEKIVRIQR
jgi:hypothetical protein